MARILLVEDAPDLGAYEAKLLESRGHIVFRCTGAPDFFTACPMLKTGSCALADAADLILFACTLFQPIRGRTYRGLSLLRAYRQHQDYGQLPMLVVTLGAPTDIGGTGPYEVLPKFSDPELIVTAADRLLERGAQSTHIVTQERDAGRDGRPDGSLLKRAMRP